MTRLSFFLAFLACLPALGQITNPPDLATAPPAGVAPKPVQITRVTTGYDAQGRKITRLDIDLQNAPNNMEPVAEPRQIRVDDRSHVQFLLRNLSPLDVCTRTASTPTANAETPAIESLVTTAAGFGGVFASSNPVSAQISTALSGTAATVTSSTKFSMEMSDALQSHNDNIRRIIGARASNACRVPSDPEYQSFNARFVDFSRRAPAFIGTARPDGMCRNDQADQVELACEIDHASRDFAGFAGADYRGRHETMFVVAGNPVLTPIRDAFTNAVASIQNAGALQALIDEMTTYAGDLHKKYDFKVSAGGDSPAPPPVIPGVLMVAPTALSFTSKGTTQKLNISSGGASGIFTAVPSSDSGWLMIARTSSAQPSANPLTDTAPDQGTFPLLVSVKDGVVDDGGTHYGSIVITGTGQAKGRTIINVVVKPADGTSPCDLDALAQIDKDLDRAKALLSIITDANKALQTAQTALKGTYTALLKVEDDFHRRESQHIVEENTRGDGSRFLVQLFDLGTDRKNTSPGYLSCLSDVNMTTATTTNINYSLLYQDVPHWTASVGFLVSFQPNVIVGITQSGTATPTVPAGTSYFAKTTQTPAQIFPMAYVNYRLGSYKSTLWGSTKENELVWTFNPSFGFGVNPNTGTNQPEFFGGFAIGWNRFMLHPGVHIGHTQTLGGGYGYGAQVPSGVTTPPLDWAYRFKFSIGFSVRVAPY
jgi:hypothetical protein